MDNHINNVIEFPSYVYNTNYLLNEKNCWGHFPKSLDGCGEEYDYCDILLRPRKTNMSSRKDPNPFRTYTFKWSKKNIIANGLMVSNMSTTGTFKMAEVMQYNKMFCCLHKHYTFEELKEFLETNNQMAKTFDEKLCGNDYIFVSTGITEPDYENICKVLDLGICENVCVDVANGYQEALLTFVQNIRKKYPSSVIMAGNVVTGDMVREILEAGADIVKIGIGSGRNCITRKMTGVGRPMVSAIMDCQNEADLCEGMICADGGVNCVGDIVKAYATGADFVMCGGMFAGTDEADNELLEKVIETDEYDFDVKTVYAGTDYEQRIHIPNTKKYKLVKYKQTWGMASAYAQEKYGNGVKKYGAAEGIVTNVPYTGSCQEVLNDYIGGLRSAMTYLNAHTLEEIFANSCFYKVRRILNNDGVGV